MSRLSPPLALHHGRRRSHQLRRDGLRAHDREVLARGRARRARLPVVLGALGVPLALRARIEGEGVGAVRHCEFSTGAFVEPVTAWEPGRRLAFDVVEQPPPMQQWSPYRHLHPPHLDASLRSVRGEFRIVPLPDGRTRLEGSTWYTLSLGPEPYFRLWSDAVIHRVHLRVLDHVRHLAEAGPASAGATSAGARGD